MTTPSAPFRLAVVLAFGMLACGGDSADPDNQQEEPPPSGRPDPGPGPHFSQLPVPIETLARITPIGYTNKIMPIPHTYWLTCDFDILLRSDRPCHREKQQLRAPRGGVILDMLAAEDGYVVVEGPPGLIWHFGHVTPAPGLTKGSSFSAGQVIATMYYDHGFDFGMDNYGIENPFIRPERYPEGYLCRARRPAAGSFRTFRWCNRSPPSTKTAGCGSAISRSGRRHVSPTWAT